MKPYYSEAGIEIYHGDCRELLPSLPPVDLVLTDPPYGISHSSSYGASWQNTKIQGDSDCSLRDSVLSGFSMVAAFGSWKTPPIADCKGVLVWDKGPAFGMGDLTFPWKPSWEVIYIRGEGWGGRRDEGVLRGPVVISWESKGRCHPHQKPTWLFTHLLKKTDANLTLDPFMGSGTTLRAAKDLGRKAIGIEIEEKYCEIAANRLRQEVLSFA